MRYSIINKNNEISNQVAAELQQKLTFLEEDSENPELIICVGGDGTILHAVHQYMHLVDKIKFVGIHTGTLGFLTDYTKDEVDLFVEDIKKDDYTIFKANLLEIKAYFKNEIKTVHALNEMRIESILKTQHLDIYIDNEYFETFKGSGVCVCSQLGSTAVNRALKGAVVDDGIQLMQMCEITGLHNHTIRSLGNPYIMKTNRKIDVCSKKFSEAYLCYDHKHMKIDEALKISCTTSQHQIQFVRYRPYSYLKRLKNLY